MARILRLIICYCNVALINEKVKKIFSYSSIGIENGVILMDVMDKEQLKEFAKEIMKEMNLAGGKISKLIQTIAPKFEYDKKRIKVQIKRALIGHQE